MYTKRTAIIGNNNGLVFFRNGRAEKERNRCIIFPAQQSHANLKASMHFSDEIFYREVSQPASHYSFVIHSKRT